MIGGSVFLLAAADGEDAIYLQLLVVVILAAAGGVYTLARSRARKGRPWHLPRKPAFLSQLTSPRSAASQTAATVEPAVSEIPAPKKRDTKTGLEIVNREFLVEVVERTDAVDNLDISMRSMCFDELVRRNELSALSSEALKVYVLNESEFFSKTIRREAMTQLAGRTGQKTRTNQ
jgi:hypothetical protein